MAGGKEGGDRGGSGRLGREGSGGSGGLAWPGEGSPWRPSGGSPELVRERMGLLGGYSGLSSAFAAVAALEARGWSWGGAGGVAGGEEGYDCGGGGRLGRGVGSGWGLVWSGDEKSPASSGQLTGAGPRKEGVAGAVRAVCPPYSLQWVLFWREGGLGEGCGVAGGQVGGRLSGFRAVGEGRRWWLGGWLGRVMRTPPGVLR